jgi:hypothetical protein
VAPAEAIRNPTTTKNRFRRRRSRIVILGARPA